MEGGKNLGLEWKCVVARPLLRALSPTIVDHHFTSRFSFHCVRRLCVFFRDASDTQQKGHLEAQNEKGAPSTEPTSPSPAIQKKIRRQLPHLDFKGAVKEKLLYDDFATTSHHEGSCSGYRHCRRFGKPPLKLCVENREGRAENDLRT